ncbi:hypothetical protein [Paenibacillus odorifer]|uniref:hypothetical protein n=1 Tax=Paenibacillus odorifer TaxID=189426 RepID=UPI001115A623|nr:hypothetical protein [Paenibacillus odorifer]
MYVVWENDELKTASTESISGGGCLFTKFRCAEELEIVRLRSLLRQATQTANRKPQTANRKPQTAKKRSPKYREHRFYVVSILVS